MKLLCDNKATIATVNNSIRHDQTKHMEVDRHFIKDQVDKAKISLLFATSNDQLVDVLTKVVSGKVFQSLLDKLRMINTYSPTLRGSVGVNSKRNILLLIISKIV